MFFYTGLQKVLYGTYFDAQFLGLTIGHKPSFAWLFGLVLPADELARLVGRTCWRRARVRCHPQPPRPGDDQRGVDLRAAHAGAAGLAPHPAVGGDRRRGGHRRDRGRARELLFGVLFVNLLLLFYARPVNRALLPLSLAILAVLAGVRLGPLPAFWFN
ncbi:MAG: hypothetical protein U0802_08275 [Candidatus Binatia bacterium]